MPDSTNEFFNGLGRRGHEPLLSTVSGTVRFDLERDQQTDHWFLNIQKGNIEVSREQREADCVIHAEEACFDGIARGEVKPLTAWLRNEVAVDGRFQFLVLLERILPSPPGAHDPRVLAREGRRQP